MTSTLAQVPSRSGGRTSEGNHTVLPTYRGRPPVRGMLPRIAVLAPAEVTFPQAFPAAIGGELGSPPQSSSRGRLGAVLAQPCGAVSGATMPGARVPAHESAHLGRHNSLPHRGSGLSRPSLSPTQR